jgi:hypothetical protein
MDMAIDMAKANINVRITADRNAMRAAASQAAQA